MVRKAHATSFFLDEEVLALNQPEKKLKGIF